MFRTNSLGIPSLVNQPRARQMRIVQTENLERLAGDKARRAPENLSLLFAKSLRGPARKEVRSPENFVSHPIPDSGEAFLAQEDSLNWRAAVSVKEAVEEGVAKRMGSNFRDAIIPPVRCIFSVMKTGAPEQARIAQDERLLSLLQNKVIVFSGDK